MKQSALESNLSFAVHIASSHSNTRVDMIDTSSLVAKNINVQNAMKYSKEQWICVDTDVQNSRSDRFYFCLLPILPVLMYNEIYIIKILSFELI